MSVLYRSYFRCAKYLTASESRAVGLLVEQCGDEFCPPLSVRRSVRQKGATKRRRQATYLDSLLGQDFVFAKGAGSIIGFLSYWLAEDGSYHVSTIIVDPAYRKHGVGGALLDALMGKTSRPLALHTWRGNTSMVRLVESRGFILSRVENEHQGDESVPSLYYKWEKGYGKR